jgi:uncharacterized iron-regulated membrane protein
MVQITMVLGSVALFVAGFVAWYTLWHRRIESAFERVRVGNGRKVHLLRLDVPGGSLDR